MKTLLYSAILLLLALAIGRCSTVESDDYSAKAGDILFQSLPHAPLVDTIEGATNSKYSHCGILFSEKGEWFVLEAIGPVKATPLKAWIDQGRGKHFWVYRLRSEIQDKIPAILEQAKRYLGRPYDFNYTFDDEHIYCSELVFKAVKLAAKIELGEIQKLGDLNWEPYKDVILQIVGKVPLEQELISPRSLSQSEYLTKVYSR